MYEEFFGLRANPFHVTPDPRYLLLTPEVREALACLSYGVQHRKGFVVLTGEVGTGKTTLLRRLLDIVGRFDIATAFVFNPGLDAADFFRFILADFGISSGSTSKGDALLHLNNWLLARHAAGQTTALIIDEAQDLSAEMLEEIRLLTNLETPTQKLLQVVLAGQPEFETRLRKPELRQLRQRVALWCRTRALSCDETHAYIRERLRIAGADTDAVFKPEAVDRIFEYSMGIPRVTNLLCEHALINAYVQQSRPVGVAIVDAVAQELQLDELSPIAGSTDQNSPWPSSPLHASQPLRVPTTMYGGKIL